MGFQELILRGFTNIKGHLQISEGIMKKIVVFIILAITLIILIELFIWNNQGEMIETNVELETAKQDAGLVVNENEPNESKVPNDENVISHPLLDKGEFSEGGITYTKGSLSRESLDTLYDILGDIYRVAKHEKDIKELEGVDSKDVEGYNPSFKGALKLFEKHSDYSIRNSVQLNQNLYLVRLLLSSPGDEETIIDPSELLVTYNIKSKRVSFEQLVQRKQINVVYSDDKMRVTAFLLQTNMKESKVFVAVENLTDSILENNTLPAFTAKCKLNDGNEYHIPLNLYTQEPLLPGIQYYESSTTFTVIDVISINIKKLKN